MNNKTMSSFKDLERLKTDVGSTGETSQLVQSQRKDNAGLHITLKRKLEVKRYPVIAQLIFQRERKDLVSLLKATQQNPAGMPKRLTAYLQWEQLWDQEAASLTSKGKEVVDTGYVDEKEEGLYHIWYTDKDSLLGTRPLFIQRDTAFFDPDIRSSSSAWKKSTDAISAGFGVLKACEINMLEETYDGQRTRQSQHRLTLKSLKPDVLCSSEVLTHLDLEWELGLRQSVVSLKGQLDVLDFSQKKKTLKPCILDLDIEDHHEHLNELLGVIASQLNGRWDDSAKRVALESRDVGENQQVIQDFELDKYNISELLTNVGVFGSIEVSHLPVMPADLDDAQQWHKAWLNNFHSKAYRKNSESRQQQSKWLDHKAIAEFDLPLKSGQELLNCFKREGQPESYWHAAAMMDLSPSNSKKHRLPITLMNSDVLDIKELVEQLTSGDSIHYMIYSDRYVHTNRQSRNLKSIASCVNIAEGLLMTLDPPRGKNEAELPENWERQILSKQNDNHGRYWVFIGNSHSWCWECSSGLDFIRDNNSKFTVEGTPGFTSKEEGELPKYLQETIKKIKNAEVM